MAGWETGVHCAGGYRRSHVPSLPALRGCAGYGRPTRLRTVPRSTARKAGSLTGAGVHLQQSWERRPEGNTCRPARKAPVNVMDAQPGTPHWHTPQATHPPPLTLSCGSAVQIRIQFFEPRSPNSSSRRPDPCRRWYNHRAVRAPCLRPLAPSTRPSTLVPGHLGPVYYATFCRLCAARRSSNARLNSGNAPSMINLLLQPVLAFQRARPFRGGP